MTQPRQVAVGASHLSLPEFIPEEVVRQLLHAMLATGTCLLDTADSYGWLPADAHVAEALLGRLLAELDPEGERIILATKGGFVHNQGKWEFQADPFSLEKAIERSFRALGGRRPIPLWQLHAPDPDVPIAHSLGAAVRAQKQGLVERIGVSNVSANKLRQALDTAPLASVQNQHSPWFRQPDCEEVFSLCRENHLRFLAHTPLGGRNALQLLSRLSAVTQLAQKYNAGVYAVVIAWLLREDPNLMPLTGTTKPENLKANQDACHLVLDTDEWQRLDTAFTKARLWLERRQA